MSLKDFLKKPDKKSVYIERARPNEDEYILPLITVKGAVFGPEINTSFDFGKLNSIAAIEYSPKTSNIIAIAMQTGYSEDSSLSMQELGQVCCLADVREITRISHEVLRVNLFGLRRVRIEALLAETPFTLARVCIVKSFEGEGDSQAMALSKILYEKFTKLMALSGNYEEIGDSFSHTSLSPERLCDTVMAIVTATPSDYFEIMKEEAITTRIEKAIAFVAKACNTAELEIELDNKLMLQLSTEQRSRYLREKKNLIARELKDDDSDEEIEAYKEKIDALPLAEEFKSRLLKEMYRLDMTPPGSQESAVIQSYLDTVVDLPWKAETSNDFDIADACSILNNEHSHLEKVKERIIEYIAVMKKTNSIKSPILCLVGPPGVGKTSIAKSIANATNRKFVRVSLGGMHDEAEIRGHRKTYVGAMPGRIISGLRQVQSKNPVFLLDEIDKMSREIKGDPSAALLEVLDPEQNSSFTDSYIEVPFDLSDVMFVTTANTTSTIPAALLDRLEVIELSGYMADEKIEIANAHLIPKQLKANGITEKDISFTEEVLYSLIDNYTRETGVRQLERAIASLCRKAAKAIVVDGEQKLELTLDNLAAYMGKQLVTFDLAKDESIIGVANGLAWTGSGGDTLSIEANFSPGTGRMELTGNLGDVMKESARTAIGFLKANAEAYGLESFEWMKNDIHIHMPEGAVPKDGPSAGITIATSIFSAVSKSPVSQKTAMTGEITLTGRVLPIGGLKEKLLAANRAQITRVIVPRDNKVDIEEIPEKITGKMEICYAEHIHDVFGKVFDAGRAAPV
ncbi:MAG: endopeptidase La [Eubacteriaceae bacterium]|nr:endopeptidase La [Eubacteriaceae bacterium]